MEEVKSLLAILDALSALIRILKFVSNANKDFLFKFQQESAYLAHFLVLAVKLATLLTVFLASMELISADRFATHALSLLGATPASKVT